MFNIREGNRNDMARFIRNITNRSIALVLSGGGARGFCHLGLMRALEELKINVDYVAGTSVGAIFAAFLAMELSYEELYTDLTKSLKNYHSLVDYTIPIHALAGGKRLDEILQHWLTSHVMIENLWRPSFYVATDLSSGELAVLNKGCLWRAVRASASLPGVFPPVADENGRILVDGAILNNLPVDIMSRHLHDSAHGRGRIIAVSIETIDNSFKYRGSYQQPKQGIVSQLSQKMGLNKEGEKIELPSIFLTISKSMMIASEQHMKEMLKHATHNVIINPKGYDLLDFKNVLKAVDIGYTSALTQLKKIAKEL